MTCFPIVLYPDALQLAWQQRPGLPELSLTEPQPHTAPARIETRAPLITITATLVIAALSFPINPKLGLRLLLLGGSLTLSHSLVQSFRYHQSRRQWRWQHQRFDQQLEAYQRRQETHQQLCGEIHHPKAIAEYQHQLVLAALQTATGYDKETPPATNSNIIPFFRPYLEQYFPGKIKTNLAIYQAGCQDFHRSELAYIDDLHSLFIDIEIDEPYSSSESRHPTHCQSNAADGEHNDFFLDNGWVVIRFSEAQIVNTPRRCCRRIAQEIYKITIASGLINRFTRVPELDPHPQWTWQEAQNMIEYGSRDADLQRIHTKLRQQASEAHGKTAAISPPKHRQLTA